MSVRNFGSSFHFSRVLWKGFSEGREARWAFWGCVWFVWFVCDGAHTNMNISFVQCGHFKLPTCTTQRYIHKCVYSIHTQFMHSLVHCARIGIKREGDTLRTPVVRRGDKNHFCSCQMRVAGSFVVLGYHRCCCPCLAGVKCRSSVNSTPPRRAQGQNSRPLSVT